MNRIALILAGVLCICLLCSCESKEKQVTKIKDIDITVVEEEDIPEELLNSINEKKKDPFKLTYTSKGNDYLYIAIGYGAQKTGGYSISIDAVYLTDNAIYFDTNLIGPGQDEVVTQVISYPYVVVKMEYMDKKVVFE